MKRILLSFILTFIFANCSFSFIESEYGDPDVPYSFNTIKVTLNYDTDEEKNGRTVPFSTIGEAIDYINSLAPSRSPSENRKYAIIISTQSTSDTSNSQEITNESMLEIPEYVSLYGGFNKNFARDISKFKTIIQNPDSSDDYILKVSNNTKIDGVYFQDNGSVIPCVYANGITENVAIKNNIFLNNVSNRTDLNEGLIYCNDSKDILIEKNEFDSNRGVCINISGNIAPAVSKYLAYQDVLEAYKEKIKIIENDFMSNNYASAIFINQGSPLIYKNNFTGNEISSDLFNKNHGSCIFSQTSLSSQDFLWIEENTFDSNSNINGQGGSICIKSLNAIITKNDFNTNYSYYEGGAVSIIDNSDVVLYKNNFDGNSCDLNESHPSSNLGIQNFYGGAVFIQDSKFSIEENNFSSNYAVCGGSCHIEDSWGNINKNKFENNFLTNISERLRKGGAIYISNSLLENISIDANLFYENGYNMSGYSPHQGGAIYAQNSSPANLSKIVLTNNIFFSNFSSFGGSLFLNQYDSYIAHNSFLENELGGSTIGLPIELISKNGYDIYAYSVDSSALPSHKIINNLFYTSSPSISDASSSIVSSYGDNFEIYNCILNNATNDIYFFNNPENSIVENVLSDDKEFDLINNSLFFNKESLCLEGALLDNDSKFPFIDYNGNVRSGRKIDIGAIQYERPLFNPKPKNLQYDEVNNLSVPRFYVSLKTGSDDTMATRGSEQYPFQTIPYAISRIEESRDSSSQMPYLLFVSGGEHTPPEDLSNCISITKGFAQIYGGFNPYNFRDRNIYKYPTILNSQRKGSVVNITLENDFDAGLYAGHCTIDGFFIVNGFAQKGGGICIQNYAYSGNNLVVSNNFLANNNSFLGGGIHVGSCGTTTKIIVKNNYLHANKAIIPEVSSGLLGQYGGGGFSSREAKVEIHNNNFSQNLSESYGGGILLATGTSCFGIYNNVFSKNTVDGSKSTSAKGGALSCLGCGANFFNNTLFGNSIKDRTSEPGQSIAISQDEDLNAIDVINCIVDRERSIWGHGNITTTEVHGFSEESFFNSPLADYHVKHGIVSKGITITETPQVIYSKKDIDLIKRTFGANDTVGADKESYVGELGTGSINDIDSIIPETRLANISFQEIDMSLYPSHFHRQTNSTVKNIFYVSSANGQDYNTGLSPTDPIKTIETVFTKISDDNKRPSLYNETLNTQRGWNRIAIFLEKGEYTIPAGGINVNTLNGNDDEKWGKIDFYGGFDFQSQTNKRSVFENKTIIRKTTVNSDSYFFRVSDSIIDGIAFVGSKNLPNCAVKIISPINYTHAKTINIKNCMFYNNYLPIDISSQTSNISQNYFYKNNFGIYIYGNSKSVINGNIFIENQSYSDEGTINKAGVLFIEGGNSEGSNTPIITNNVISKCQQTGNTNNHKKSSIYLSGTGYSRIYGNTVVNNLHGLYVKNPAKIDFWGNIFHNPTDIEWDTLSYGTTISNSYIRNIESSTFENIITKNNGGEVISPEFVQGESELRDSQINLAQKFDYRLKENSPCVDALEINYDRSQFLNTTDVLMKKRVTNQKMDMGAYEYNSQKIYPTPYSMTKTPTPVPTPTLPSGPVIPEEPSPTPEATIEDPWDPGDEDPTPTPAPEGIHVGPNMEETIALSDYSKVFYVSSGLGLNSDMDSQGTTLLREHDNPDESPIPENLVPFQTLGKALDYISEEYTPSDGNRFLIKIQSGLYYREDKITTPESRAVYNTSTGIWEDSEIETREYTDFVLETIPYVDIAGGYDITNWNYRSGQKSSFMGNTYASGFLKVAGNCRIDGLNITGFSVLITSDILESMMIVDASGHFYANPDLQDLYNTRTSLSGAAINMYNVENVIVSNCWIADNIVRNYPVCGGGGIGIYYDNDFTPSSASSSIIIRNNEIKKNTTQFSIISLPYLVKDEEGTVSQIGERQFIIGGGIMAAISNDDPLPNIHLTINNNDILDNKSGSYGGGAYISEFISPKLYQNKFSNNYINPEIPLVLSGANIGGGLCMVHCKDAEIYKNMFYNCRALQGGGSYIAGCYGNTLLKSNTIVRNEALMGGGIFLDNVSIPEKLNPEDNREVGLVNNIITQNKSNYDAPGIQDGLIFQYEIPNWINVEVVSGTTGYVAGMPYLGFKVVSPTNTYEVGTIENARGESAEIKPRHLAVWVLEGQNSYPKVFAGERNGIGAGMIISSPSSKRYDVFAVHNTIFENIGSGIVFASKNIVGNIFNNIMKTNKDKAIIRDVDFFNIISDVFSPFPQEEIPAVHMFGCVTDWIYDGNISLFDAGGNSNSSPKFRANPIGRLQKDDEGARQKGRYLSDLNNPYISHTYQDIDFNNRPTTSDGPPPDAGAAQIIPDEIIPPSFHTPLPTEPIIEPTRTPTPAITPTASLGPTTFPEYNFPKDIPEEICYMDKDSSLVYPTQMPTPFFQPTRISGVKNINEEYKEIYYVSNYRGNNANAGTAEEPFKDIQTAINKAKEEVLVNFEKIAILVSQGNYNSSGQEISVIRFDTCKNIHVYGGYDDTFGSRNIFNNKSVINGSFVRTCVSTYMSSEIVIDGFYITMGKPIYEELVSDPSKDAGVPKMGGGIFCERSSNITISNNIIYNNRGFLGGAISTFLSRAYVYDNIISNNCAWRGAGLTADNNSQVEVIKNTFINNQTFSFEGFPRSMGGAIASLWGSSVIGDRNYIMRNKSSFGGGIAVSNHGYVWMSNSIISDNVVEHDLEHPSCREMGWDVFAIYYNNTSTGQTILEPRNDIVFRSVGGGGIGVSEHSKINLLHTTIACNKASCGLGGGIFALYSSHVDIKNSIVWRNLGESECPRDFEILPRGYYTTLNDPSQNSGSSLSIENCYITNTDEIINQRHLFNLLDIPSDRERVEAILRNRNVFQITDPFFVMPQTYRQYNPATQMFDSISNYHIHSYSPIQNAKNFDGIVFDPDPNLNNQEKNWHTLLKNNPLRHDIDGNIRSPYFAPYVGADEFNRIMPIETAVNTPYPTLQYCPVDELGFLATQPPTPTPSPTPMTPTATFTFTPTVTPTPSYTREPTPLTPYPTYPFFIKTKFIAMASDIKRENMRPFDKTDGNQLYLFKRQFLRPLEIKDLNNFKIRITGNVPQDPDNPMPSSRLQVIGVMVTYEKITY